MRPREKALAQARGGEEEEEEEEIYSYSMILKRGEASEIMATASAP